VVKKVFVIKKGKMSKRKTKEVVPDFSSEESSGEEDSDVPEGGEEEFLFGKESEESSEEEDPSTEYDEDEKALKESLEVSTSEEDIGSFESTSGIRKRRRS
jgi:hypothetical protein